MCGVDMGFLQGTQWVGLAQAIMEYYGLGVLWLNTPDAGC